MTMDGDRQHGREFICFGPGQNFTKNGVTTVGDFLVGSNGIARRGTPQAEWILSAKPARPTAHNTNPKSKLQAIKPILDAKPLSTSNEPVTTPMNDTSNISLLERIKDPAFRWTVLYILLALLIYCLWPRDEYASMGQGLILNKRTGEVHRAYDRLGK